MTDWKKLWDEYDAPPLGQSRTMIIKRIRAEGGLMKDKLDDVGEWAFNMACMYEDCTYMSREAFDKDAKKALKELIKLAGPWVPPDIRDTTETTEVEPEPDKYEGFKVFDYLKITEEAFMALPPGICRHPDCDRETGTGMALCQWHSTAFGKWGKKMGAPTI